ncbi:MAG: response regulator, partial [Lachnospiraceae bacterium]|nr:response regulator [Lachnospiraceae bacterium]
MRRLVIVDDEYIVVEGIKAIIQRTGMDIKVVGSAGNGREALETIREMQPDLVITDIRIPYLDGLSLIEECREFLPETDYIVISGYTEFEYARRALLLGVKGYIDKPVTIEKLKDVIDRIGTEPPKESGGLQDTLSMQQSPFVPQHKE